MAHPVIIAIDPGPKQSAWLVFNPHTRGIRGFGITPNDELLDRFRAGVSGEVASVVIEKIESFGMAVGAEIFDTVFWTGRFTEALHPIPVDQLPRRAIKTHLCGSAKAKDTNIRQVLLDRWDGAAAARKGGALYGISKDVWSALAIAVTYVETRPGRAA